MVVNAGVRFDYFDPRGYVPENFNDPVLDPEGGGEIKNPRPAKVKWDICPRLGIAHPITERDVLHFTYGHYFEVPRLYYLFANSNFDMHGAFGLIGNANMDVERTIAYEMGINHAFTPDFKMTIVTFYKDITGLATTQQTYRDLFNWYGLYTNGDYGHARGIEVTLYKRPSHDPFYGTLAYTFQVAKGRYSSARASYVAIWGSKHRVTQEHYLDWDQRHTVKLNLGIKLPYRIGINIITRYGSGFPYTPPSKDPYVVPYNTERFPYTINTDVKFSKDIEIGPVSGGFFFDILNIFDRRNLISVANIEWYHRYKDPEGSLHYPGVWSYRRRIRSGIQIKF
jgi:outer membrane receptor protein involved in Fe transport